MKMNYRMKDFLFLVLIITLIFNKIPTFIQVNFIGGSVGSKLAFYPLLIGFVYSAYYYCKSKIVPPYFKQFLQFISFYIGVLLISLLVGLITYPYYDVVFSAPLSQIEKLPKLLGFLAEHGIYLDEKYILCLWIIARTIKGVFLETLWCFGGAYMIFCWYCDNWRAGVKILTNGALASLVVIFAYSMIEVFYLAGSNDAQSILKIVTPYLHRVKTSYGWWPPLLWKGQLRSIFAEPSYFGIFAAFVLPCLWYKLICSSKKIYFFIITLFSFLLFLTKARTAFMLHLGELLLLLGFTMLYLRNREYMKRITVVFLCGIMAFITSNLFIANVMEKTQNIPTTQSITKYVDSNAASLANPDSRSNRARYSVMEADLKIGLNHPVLGVGSGLRDAYMPDYFSIKGLQNKEIQMWINYQKHLGVFRCGYPSLGEYTSRFAETGILGLICFLVPPFYLLYNLFKKISFLSMKERLPFIMYLISFMGIMVSGIGDTLNITYCYWVLLGLGYAMCFGECKNEESGGQ